MAGRFPPCCHPCSRLPPYLFPRQVAQELPGNHNSILLPSTSCHGNLTQPGKRETRALTEILYGRLGSLSETLTHPICDCARTSASRRSQSEPPGRAPGPVLAYGFLPAATAKRGN